MEAVPPRRIHLDVRLVAQRGSGRLPLVVRVFKFQVSIAGFLIIEKLRVSLLLNSNNVAAIFSGERRNLLLFLLVSLAINFTAIKFLIGGAKQGSGAISSIKAENPSIGAAEGGGEKIVFASLDTFNSGFATDTTNIKNKATTALPIASKESASETVNSSKKLPSIASSGGDSQARVSEAEVIEQKGSNPQDVPNTPTNSQFSFDGMPAMPLAVPGTTSRGLFSRPPEAFPIPQAVSDPKQLAQSKRIRIQAKVNESISKLRGNWQRDRTGAECLVWVDPDWHQFSVDCDPVTPSRSDLISALSSSQFTLSQTMPDISWHCIRVGTEQNRKTCPDPKK